MKLFIPAAKDDAQAEQVYEGIRKFAAENTWGQIADRRIFSLKYTHNGKPHTAEVGKACSANGQIVVAILESTTYLVCTGTRGVLRGDPIFVGKDEVDLIVDFERTPAPPKPMLF